MAKNFNKNPQLVAAWKEFRKNAAQEGLNYYPKKIEQYQQKLEKCKSIAN